MPDYPKEQLQELYENLPKELQEAVFSQENGDNIYQACTRNNIKDDDQINQVAKYTGYVLLGLLRPDDFQKKLEKELKIEEETAKQIALEINRFVFYPVKDSLEALYEITIKSDNKAGLEKPKGKDPYRELVK